MMNGSGPRTSPEALRAVAASARDEQQVMAAVDAVALGLATSSVPDVVDQLERELASRSVTGRSVVGPALVVLAQDVLLRSRLRESNP